MEESQAFFSEPLVCEVAADTGSPVFVRRSRAMAVACGFLSLLILGEAWVVWLFTKHGFPASTTPMGTIANGIVRAILAGLGGITLLFLARGALSLFRYWTMTVDTVSKEVSVRCRTPLGLSKRFFAFDEIDAVVLGRGAISAHWIVQLCVGGKLSVRHGGGPRPRAEALATRLCSLTGARVREV